MGVPSKSSVRNYEQTLLQQADSLALGLLGLRSIDPERAGQLLVEIVDRLGASGRGGDAVNADSPPESDRPRPVLVSLRDGGGGDRIEEFVLDILFESPKGLSVQELVEQLKIAELAIKRETLVVRLHRMQRAGKLVSLAHGHYALSEIERGSRE